MTPTTSFTRATFDNLDEIRDLRTAIRLAIQTSPPSNLERRLRALDRYLAQVEQDFEWHRHEDIAQADASRRDHSRDR